ncbi:MAG: A24 family peptidase [Oscillospiraceae bacterium]|nr:A24 family peptidase [Oscillospiraceae bacterium]
MDILVVCGAAAAATALSYPPIRAIPERDPEIEAKARTRAGWAVRLALLALIYSVSFTALYLEQGIGPYFLMAAPLFAILTVASFIDADYLIIPNGLVIACLAPAAAAFAHNVAEPAGRFLHAWWGPFLGLIPGTAFLLAVYAVGRILLRKEGMMGMGDIKLFMPLGLFAGLALTFMTLFVSCVLGSAYQLALIAAGRRTRRDPIPFAPFITAGFMVSCVYGERIIDMYLRLY